MMALTLHPDWDPVRYNVINDKCPREIVMLRGRGCFWGKCAFCDYHLDQSRNEDDNFLINQAALDQVTGIHGALEVINSGSFPELDKKTQEYIKKVCKEKGITTIYIETHYHYKDVIGIIKKNLAPLTVYVKLGIETFDINYREQYLNKNIGNVSAEVISKDFEDCCLLIGMQGQTPEMISNDIITAEKFFNRICINVFIENGTAMKADASLITWFLQTWYPQLIDNDRFDILLDNNAFGVGGVCSAVE